MFWLVPSAVYWSSASVVAYTYVGYPLLIGALSRLRPKPIRKASIEPSLSIVLAAHNERRHIEAKLDNLLSLDYPEDKKQIIVVSDGSDDGTDDIVRSYADRKVELLRLDTPSGKPSALNLGVSKARGELVVFCDARQRIDSQALRHLASCFADETVGAASGELEIDSDAGPGLYWRYEKLIRAAESRFASVPGATGALYAIRRELFRPLPPDSLLDDVFTPMQIALQGLRVVLEPQAKAYDREASIAGEFRRKARTLSGNYQLLKHLPEVLSPRRNPIFFQFMSHKVARLACPFALVSLFGSNLWLCATLAPGAPLYAVTLGGQLAFYEAALFGALAPQRAGKLSRAAHTFVVLNAAAVEGLRRFATGSLSWR